MSMIAELVSGKKYYGKHATGRVLIVNGQPEWHGPTKEARRVLKDLVEECRKLKLKIEVLGGRTDDQTRREGGSTSGPAVSGKGARSRLPARTAQH